MTEILFLGELNL